MAQNTIATRIYDFLKDFPPFHLLEKDQLLRISRQVVVQYRQPGEVVFRQGASPGHHIYVIREGAVRLLREEEGRRILVDQCAEGDLFGIRPLLAREDYALTAEVAEESLIYAIGVEGWDEALQHNSRVAYYLASTMASGWRNNYSKKYHGKIFLDRESREETLFEVQPLEYSKPPVTCGPDTSIREAARIMSRKEVSSIIVVDERQRPLGIATDKDLRHRVATGEIRVDTPVRRIMSSPVITLPPSVTVADVQIEMVRHRIHHLCLTADGTRHSEVVGVLTEHDILVAQGNNPAILIRELRRAKDGVALRQIRERAEKLLRNYIYQEVSIAFISTVMTEINDGTLARAMELSRRRLRGRDMEEPALRYCWLSLGSQGRGEQLLRTDQDHALIFETVPAERLEPVRKYFLALAGEVSALLQECGFEYCPAGMMASNPQWCLSLPEWKRQFGRWMEEPVPEAIMHSAIFFDFRPVYGDAALAEALTRFIFDTLDTQMIFLGHMANNALKNPPPLTFFRNFMLEKSGEHKNEFDIKARAMMPLADGARVLTLHGRISHVNNTFRRFEKLAEQEPQNRQLYEQAAEAYEILMRYRTLQGLKQGDSGRYFDPSELSKMERVNLRNCFQSIRDLQSLLSTRFQTAFFS